MTALYRMFFCSRAKNSSFLDVNSFRFAKVGIYSKFSKKFGR